jgi:hypothetical protein
MRTQTLRRPAAAGDTIRVTVSGEVLTVGAGNTAVSCGNIPTANAMVQVVDIVLLA